MAAGMSRKQFKNRVYKLLKRTQWKLEKAGVKSVYKNYQLCADTTGRPTSNLGFNISFRRLDASNGETAGIPSIIVIDEQGNREEYGWCTSKHGNFDKGIERIIELFAKKTPDFFVQNHGSIFLLQPLTQAASEWIEEHLPEDRQYFGTAVAVEHRYIADIVGGIQRDGLTVE